MYINNKDKQHNRYPIEQSTIIFFLEKLSAATPANIAVTKKGIASEIPNKPRENSFFVLENTSQATSTARLLVAKVRQNLPQIKFR
jgi:hypothetical protein